MKEKSVEERIVECLDKVRPYMLDEGGDVKFNRFENGVVYVSLIGACSHCSFAEYTLDGVVEEALLEEVPEVIKVVNED